MPNTPSTIPPASETRPASAPLKPSAKPDNSEYRFLTYKEIQELLEKQACDR